MSYADLHKLEILAELEGFDSPQEYIEEFAISSVVPGICCNSGCDYITNVEPDSEGGWCELCDTNTVKSGLVLAGVI